MISLVMPTYDRAPTLPRAIESVLAQTHEDWELLIVDDGSTDDTAEVLARYGDARIRSFRHERNRGVTAALNTGFDHLQGQWFAVLGSDDEVVPEAFATLLGTATRTGAEAITCNCRDSQTGEMTGHGWDADGWKTGPDMTDVSGEHWGLTKTSLLAGTRFDERLPGYEGVLWMKITHRAGRRYYLHKALRVYHTEGEDRVTVSAQARPLAAILRTTLDLTEDGEYLECLRTMNPGKYARLRRRALQAKILLGTGILDLPVVRRLRPREFYLLAGAAASVSLFALAAGTKGLNRVRRAPGR